MKDMVCRAVTFPFTPHSMSWQEFDPLLHQCWRMSTNLVNWAMTQYAISDREGLRWEEGKMILPPLPKNLYADFNKRFHERDLWKGAAIQASTVIQGALRRYRSVRRDLVLGRVSLPTFRYPYPFPVHNQTWKPLYLSKIDKVPLVNVSLPGGKVTLRLRGGHEFRRQLALFHQLMHGAKRGELSFYRKGKHPLAKLVGHFPIRAVEHDEKTMIVRTDPGALWIVEIEGVQRVWNQDHIRPLIERHRLWLQRIREDTKREKRVQRRMAKHIEQSVRKRCQKQRDRLDAFRHEMTKQLSEFASRQRVAQVIYDDALKDFLPSFDWSDLKTKLAYKLRDRGIGLVSAGESHCVS